jgi:protein-disulfide isomerase
MTYQRLLLALIAVPLLAGACARADAPAKGASGVTTPRSTAGSDEAAAAARAPQEEPAPFNILGSEAAPVAIVEFSDLQCPYCARYALQTFPQIKRVYIDTGKVHYAAIEYPLPMHAYAFPAAVAARCAGEQGKYWQYREGIFAAQSQLAPDSFDALARKLGLDVGKFDSCRRDVRQDARVREDLAMARQDGITSTPSFMIGRVVDGEFQGEVISGAKSFEEFAAKIDALLRAAR